jgi:hypothetical protein
MDSLFIKTYEVAAANHPFLLEESIVCARLLLDQLSWENIQQAVVQDQLFATSSATTAQSYLRAIRFRLENTPPDLLKLIAHEEPATVRYTLLFLLMHKNRLLRELLEEPLRDCRIDGLTQISRSDILDYFEYRRESSPALSESVLETGLLQGQEPLNIVSAPVPEPLRVWLLQREDRLSLELMFDPDETF